MCNLFGILIIFGQFLHCLSNIGPVMILGQVRFVLFSFISACFCDSFCGPFLAYVDHFQAILYSFQVDFFLSFLKPFLVLRLGFFSLKIIR